MLINVKEFGSFKNNAYLCIQIITNKQSKQIRTMCLQTSQINPKVVDKEITCYKVLRKEEHKEVFIPIHYTYHSVFYNTSEAWTLNEVCTSQLVFIRRTGQVYNAFHSFKHLVDAKKTAKRYNDCVVAKCVIPEYARYYEGHNTMMDITEGYASDKLKVVEILKN